MKLTGDALGDPRRRSIDRKLLAWMRESAPEHDEGRFDSLAREIFEFQFAHCAPYGRFCRGRGVEPRTLTHWSEIPAVPTAAFKEAALHSFPSELVRGVFRTSGTTNGKPGELYLDSFELYRASLLQSIARYVFPDLQKSDRKFSIRVLAPHPEEAPHSSLSHMFGCAILAFGAESSGYDSNSNGLRSELLLERLEQYAHSGEPVALCGTSFAFVHLLEAMGEGAAQPIRIELPKGSRIMETGGFKGRSREVERDDLYRALETHLGVAEHHIVNQYGMTELGSQFYDSILFEQLSPTAPGPRRKLGPPWARVQIIDPETGLEALPGEVGMIVVHDLANTGSIAAIETADLGRRIPGNGANGRPDGFEVLGRFPGADERGCSIAVDTIWREAAG